MIYIQTQAYSGFWSGAIVMISVHNMFLSFFLYKTRQTNISNIIKIIFNLANALRFTAVWGTYMTPKVATLLQCTALQYVAAIGNVTVRVSLTAFLLWRLKQVHNGKMDSLIGITLFLIRAGLGIAQLGFQRPSTVYNPEQDIVICNPVETTSEYYVLASNAVEFIIDIYVTIRLVQILRNANRNAASISSNITRRSRRTLFTAVMYWNFLRLFVAVLFHLMPILFIFLEDEALGITLLPIINILLSYVITVDAEIVRVIEGKDAKKGGSSAGTEKSFSTSQSPRTPRAPPHYSGHSSNDLPKYSSHTQSNGQENYTQLDEDKIVVVSMKRLSFFEWANFVVGKRLRRSNEEQYDDENTEEIIDGPQPQKPANEDLEKGIPQDRRNSNFSGTTSVSTLDENPEIVIR